MTDTPRESLSELAERLAPYSSDPQRRAAEVDHDRMLAEGLETGTVTVRDPVTGETVAQATWLPAGYDVRPLTITAAAGAEMVVLHIGTVCAVTLPPDAADELADLIRAAAATIREGR